MRIAILGGSFDPPQVGHYLISMQVKELLQMDQIWLMPAASHPFQKNLSDIKHRFAMAKLLENSFIKVSDYEIKNNPSSYTIDTLEGLSKLYRNDIFYWILGSDQLDNFQQYKNWYELVKHHSLIIFPREYVLWHLEQKVKKTLQLQSIPENVTILYGRDLLLTNISSTAIRKRVKKGLPIRYLVPEEVEEYVLKHNLYHG